MDIESLKIDWDKEAEKYNVSEILDDLREQLKEKDKEINRLKWRIVEFKNSKANTFNDYKFTSCNDCVHKVDNKFTEVCFRCKRYYGCYFEKKKEE